MKKKNIPKLSIFKTFKTKHKELTGEAKRQRSIISHLVTSTSSAAKTRTSISKRIAKDHGVVWKNIYSGIFRDLEEVLVPLGIVKEEGRLPLKRGPKALQEKGIPFYELTLEGLLISLSLKEITDRKKILEKFLSEVNIEEKEFHDILQKLGKIAPRFVCSLFEKYAITYCEGKIDNLLPLNLIKIGKISNESIGIQIEFLESHAKMSNTEKDNMISFLKKIS